MSLSLTRMRFTAAVLLTLTVVLLAMTLLDVTGTGRVVVTVLFGLVAPGWALTGFFLPLRPSVEWTLATALSLAVSTVLSTALLVLHLWHPAVAMVGLAALTGCALTWHLLRPTPAVRGILDLESALSPVGVGADVLRAETSRADTSRTDTTATDVTAPDVVHPETVEPGRPS